jgi:hypothetical protein
MRNKEMAADVTRIRKYGFYIFGKEIPNAAGLN